jgi:hypothetical protein
MKQIRLTYGLTVALLVLIFTSLSTAQAPKAVIKVKGYSPYEIEQLHMTTPRATGLQVVGVGQLVYLVGQDSAEAAVTNYAWSLSSKPGGSTAVLNSTAGEEITFKPDLEGKFVVQLVITTAGGTSAPKTLSITSAKFVGVGSMDGLGWSLPQCALCHDPNFQQWKKTGHATFFSRAIDGGAGTHYGESCIECHTVGYDKEPSAVNGGFDDVQAQLGWVFPTTLQAGNWQDMKTNYTPLAHKANIQCESCHGPGSQHVGVKENIAMSLEASACAYCHEEAPYHRKGIQWKASGHATDLEAEAVRAGCDRCHSGWGFVRRIDPQGIDNRPIRGFGKIACAVCHDPHDAELPSQVRSLDNVTLGDSVTVVNYGGMGKVCMQCHIGRVDAEDYSSNRANISSRFGPHHSNQADMYNGSNAIEYGMPIGTSGHKFAIQDACVTCHMSPTVASGQPGYDKIGEHTFSMRWDNDTPDDPSDDVENVTVCQTCHGPITKFEDIMANADFDEDGTIESVHGEIEGLLEKLGNLLPPDGPTVAISAANYDWQGKSPEETVRRKGLLKAAFNYLFVEEDGSMGVHNAAYATTLLRRSIESVSTGDVGAGEIISITDVLNDQGKQVRLAWSKFPGDGLSANPISGYAVWRRVDESLSATHKLPSKDLLFAQGTSANVGKRFATEQDGNWDFIAYVPAIGQEVYSMVVPTIFDSTAAGIRWSVFFVSAMAPGQMYETAPDSGYSVDNLVPEAPQNITASSRRNVITLHWDHATDGDFDYFAVYRGTVSGFNPKGAPAISKLTATEFNDDNLVAGDKYYYRLSSFDFSGNESEFSPEIAMVVTSVDQNGNAVPTEYALGQNYPNPFNPVTTIKYQLPQTGHVRLSVYSVLGSEVRRLVDRTQDAAYHTVVWDGLDDQGNQVPSGVYFYQIQSGAFSAMKKMTLMK